jgi:hypothetical protein
MTCRNDGGGVYSLVVSAPGTRPAIRPYHLQSAGYEADDGAPGVELANGAVATGTLDASGVDVVDVYHFGVPRVNELTKIDLRQRPNIGFTLELRNESGGRTKQSYGARGRQVFREHLDIGRYFVVVRARNKASGQYSLQIITRDVTTTSISMNGAQYLETPTGTPVPLNVQVTSASHGGPIQIEIDRLDPLFGWQFSQVLEGTIDSGGYSTTSWTPQWLGYWRARAVRRERVQHLQRKRLRPAARPG